MKLKKTPQKDLEKSKPILFQTGLVIVLLALFIAFEWRTSEIEIKGLEIFVTGHIESEIIPITRQNEPEPPKIAPPPPVKVIEKIEIVDNKNNIDDVDNIEDFFNVNNYPFVPFVQPRDDEEDDEDKVFVSVEEDPIFPGGKNAMLKFLNDNLDYAEAARINNIEGRISVYFVINEHGEVEQIKILKGLDPLLDKAAINAVKKMPKWKAGVQGGKNVKVSFVVPFYFQLQ